MGSSLVKINIHIVFHIKRHSMEIRDEDLPEVFAYLDEAGVEYDERWAFETD